MKYLGFAISAFAAFMFLAAQGMDTSVSTETGMRVHNIGLMNQQQNMTISSIGLLLVGVLIVLFGKKKRQETDEPGKETIPCPFCAEQINPAAKLCKHCKQHLPEKEAEPIEAKAERLGISKHGNLYIFKDRQYTRLEDAVDFAESEVR